MSGNHTYDVLVKIIENELKKYCTHKKCVGVVTDNARNFVKVFRKSAVTEDSEEDLHEYDRNTIKNRGEM